MQLYFWDRTATAKGLESMITRVLRNAVWLGIGEAVVKGGLLLTVVIVAHVAGPSGVGTFTIAYSAALIAVLVGALGQQEVLIREVARNPDGARGLLGVSRRAQVLVTRWLVPAAALGALLVPERGLRFALLVFLPYAVFRTATVRQDGRRSPGERSGDDRRRHLDWIGRNP
jgi:O-antigen/teichoic acid export membrane protein